MSNQLHLYNEEINPLGIQLETFDVYDGNLPFVSDPKVLKYKYSLDGLVEDIGTGKKKVKDINLAVVWKTESEWQKNYTISTTLHPDYLDYRPYHGITHKMHSISTPGDEIHLVVLSELIEYLNDPISTQKKQLKKYDEDDD